MCGVLSPPNDAPVVSVTAPADGGSAEQGANVTFTGTASDMEDGDLSASLSWSSDLDGAVGTGASVTTSTLSVGTHTITAAVTDSGGLPGSDAITFTITVPNPAPTVTITAPPDGAVVVPGAPITFTGTATDAEDGDLSAQIVWTSSKDGLLGTGASLAAPLNALGTHVITAAVTDSVGAQGAAQISVRVSRR